MKIYKSSVPKFHSLISHSVVSLMATISSCLFLTTLIFSVSGFKIFDGEDDEILFPSRRSDPDLVRADGIMRPLRSEPIFEQGIFRTLKRSSPDHFGNKSSMLNNGIMRSLKRSSNTKFIPMGVRKAANKFRISIPMEENDQDDGQTTFVIDENDRARALRSASTEEKDLKRPSLIQKYKKIYGLPLRYLTMINGK